jgi:hypothetical protein
LMSLFRHTGLIRLIGLENFQAEPSGLFCCFKLAGRRFAFPAYAAGFY